MYVIGFSTFILLSGIMSLLINLNCINLSPVPGITFLATLVNIIRIITFSFLLVLIAMQDNFRRKLKKMIKHLFQKGPLSRSESLDA